MIKCNPGFFVVESADDYGNVILIFQLGFWQLCPGCGRNIENVKIYWGGINAAKMPLFKGTKDE